MKLESSNDSNYPYYFKVAGGYLRTETQAYSTDPESYRISRSNNVPSSDYYYFTKININSTGIQSNWGYFAQIGFKQFGFNKRIYHNNTYKQYRTYNTDWAETPNRIYLYKPAQQYKVTTEVQPEASYGTISLRDGVLVDNGTNWSQKMETVQFLVTASDGKKISNVDIQALDNNQVVEHIDPLTISQTINGTLYTFVMPGHDVNIVATFEDVEYHNINMVVKPRSVCGNIFITEGYVVQNDQVKSYDGQNVVFNVTPNPINPANEAEGYYELSYVTVTINGVETTLAPDANGNYSFTMPDEEVTITAYFYDNTKSPLWLLGTANGNETWHTYGPRFNYNDETDEYYIDVYFKGTGNYGSQEGEAFGRFSVTWKIDMNDNWSSINNQNLRGVPGEPDFYVDENTTTANTIYLWYGSQYENNSFKIPAGIYRIYVGTTASQNKGNLANNQLKVEKHNVALTFEPTGGSDAASAVEVPQHQLVSLQGDLYNKIKAINPDEDDANFMYKATIDGSTTTSESAGASTTQIATLDVVNEGETVTKLEGWNYLGWIVANNTGYYKVIDTPLHWIEENGKKDNTYTVSDRLQGVYAQEGHLWCKDLGNISIVKTEPVAGQIDYLAKTLKPEGHRFDNIRIGNWDQSNWVELDFTGLGTQSEAQAMAQALQGHYITAKSVTGVYTDDVNYTIKLKAQPTADGEASYVPNTYSPSNFIESNLMIDGNVGPVLPSNGVTYYFLNPKVQEYALITYAMWDKPQQIMVIPNNAPFNGAAKIGRWDLNNPNNQLEALDAAYEAPQTTNNVYEFHIIVQRANKTYGTPAPQVQGAPGLKDNNDIPHKPNQTTTGIIMAQPLDLLVSSPLPTAINRVGTEAQVVGVEYVNIAGMRSSKPFKGVNIVVTRYSDGSTTTSKVIK